MERDSIAFDSDYPELYATIPASGLIPGAADRVRSSTESLHEYDVIPGEECGTKREEDGDRDARRHSYELETRSEWIETKWRSMVEESSPARLSCKKNDCGRRNSLQRGARNCAVVCAITATIVLAVVSLALSVLLWHGVHARRNCSCPRSDALKETLQYLQQVSDDLEVQLTHFQNVTVTRDKLAGNISSYDREVDRLNDSLIVFRNRTAEDAGVTATQHNVSRRDTCPRVREAKCVSEQENSVSLGSQLQCNASSLNLSIPDAAAKIVYCAHLDDPFDGYTYENSTAVNEVQLFPMRQEIHCWCGEVAPGEAAVPDQVVCGWFRSRCPPQLVN